MAKILPFKALRPRLAVQQSGLAAQLEGTFNPAAVLRRLQETGELTDDGPPCLFVAQTATATGAPLRFLLAKLAPGSEAMELEDVGEGARWAGVSPIPALAADDHRLLSGMMEEAVLKGEPLWVDGRAGLWRVTGPLAARLRSALAEVPLRPLRTLPADGPALVGIAPISDLGLQILPYHRAIKDVPTFHEKTFLTVVGDYARVYELEASLATPAGLTAARERLGLLAAGHHAVLLVLPGGRGRILRFRQALDLAHIKAAPRSPTLRSLDLALLNALVLKTVLGISTPEASGHPQVYAIEDLEDLVTKVDAGVFQAGFGLNPPPAWELRAVMEAGQKLPPKTLRLAPSLPTGWVYLAPGP